MSTAPSNQVFIPEPKGGISGRLREKARARASLTALVGNKSCRNERLTYGELFQEVDRVAAGFLSLGLKPGDHVGLVSENCDLWIITDLALMSLGAVDVPRGGDASADEVQFCVGHARCRAAVVETSAQFEKLGDLREKLAWVVVLKGDAPKGSISFDEVLERGRRALESDSKVVTSHLERVRPEQLATIIYTSGTTGNPKGVMLTHENILHNIAIVPSVLDLHERGRFLSFLPAWHSFERALDYIILDSGMELHYSSKWTLREDFRRVKPQFVAGVPRLWETFYNAVAGGLEKLKPATKRIVGYCLDQSRRRYEHQRAAKAMLLREDGSIARSSWLASLRHSAVALAQGPAHFLAKKLVYSKLKQALGGEVNAMISGGGPLPAHVDEFYVRAGLPLLNGYGLTETSPVLSLRLKKRNVLGTIGPPIPYTEIRIVDDHGQALPPQKRGVIQARGPQVMQGYFENPSATKAALVGGGWFDTGDIGMLSNEGDLIITGRAKDTIVLMGGENVEPEPIEAAICSSPYIAEALLVGHGKKVLGVLLVPDTAALKNLFTLPATAPDSTVLSDPRTAVLLKQEVQERISKKRGYRNFELIGHVHVLDRPFSIDDGTLTATLKKKRSVIESHHERLITSLFEND